MEKSNPITLLLVEDDDIDVELIQRAFQKMKIANEMVVAVDGVEALKILRNEHESKKIERPFMILLDLNLPKMNGIEFLEELRNDPNLQDSVVFVLTTSNADQDKLEAYKKNVAGYMVKSRINPEFSNFVDLLGGYWRYVELPPKKREWEL